MQHTNPLSLFTAKHKDEVSGDGEGDGWGDESIRGLLNRRIREERNKVNGRYRFYKGSECE
jgi:hypothetical protein